MPKNISYLDGCTVLLSEFERICSARGFSRFTIGKPLPRHCESIGGSPVINEYKIIKIFLSPNVVLFQNESSYLYFRYAKKVHIIKDTADSGLVFDVICSETPYLHPEKRYRITAR